VWKTEDGNQPVEAFGRLGGWAAGRLNAKLGVTGSLALVKKKGVKITTGTGIL
jgi:hypothetical protein